MVTIKQVLFFATLLTLSSAAPKAPELEDREIACIALNNCLGDEPSSETVDELFSFLFERCHRERGQRMATGSLNIVAPVQTSTSIDKRAKHSATARWLPIQKGYVAFGDSYAAGIGTGTTEGDGCRRGENSYPKQLAALPDGDIDFQNLPCSGAIVGEVLQGGKNSQIDAWTNPQNADIATLSIGGNDVGFYNILTACVLRVG